MQPEKKLVLVGGLLVCLVSAGAAFCYYNVLGMIHGERAIEQANAMLTQVEAARSAVVQARTAGLESAHGSRNRFLLIDALQHLDFHVHRLQELASRNPEFNKPAEQIITLTSQLEAGLANSRGRGVMAKQTDPIALGLYPDLNRIEHALTQIYDEESGWLDARSQQTHRSAEIANVGTIVATLFNLVLIGVLVRLVRKQEVVEAALSNSEREYRVLFECNPMPMWVWDKSDLRFLAVNDAAVEHYGYSREEFLSMTIRDIRPDKEVPTLLNWLTHTDEGLNRAGTWTHRKKDGSLIEVEITVNGLSFEGRRAGLALANDVTHRLRKEEQLRVSEEKFSRIFRASPVAIAITSRAEDRYVDVNDALLRLLGFKREEMIGRTIQDLQTWIHPHDRTRMLSDLEADGSSSLETALRSRSGEVKLVHVFAESIELDGVPCILAMEYDISEHKRLEEQLRHSQKMEAVGRLAGGIAHDFNNMLGVISGYSEILQEHFRPTDLPYKQFAEIKKAAERSASLTRQLLAFSRKQVLQPRLLDLHERVQELSKMLKPVMGDDVELTIRSGPQLQAIYADPSQIDQVIMNLAVNARDAMPDGGKLIIETSNAELDDNLASQHSAVKPGPYVLLAVSDTGIGMNTETLSHIFEPFFTTKDPGKGTGLGLSTVHGIIAQSGGHLWVYSEPGHGTTFKIYFPAVAREAVVPELAEPEISVITASATVLLAEDEPAMRALTACLLEKFGCRVLEAGDGLSALEIAKDHPEIDLLLTDVIMPGLSGPELWNLLKISHPTMGLVYLSGYSDELLASHGALKPGTALLQKPYTRQALMAAVQTALANRNLSETGAGAIACSARAGA